MNPVLKKILETGCVEQADGQKIELHSNISPAEGEFLQGLIREVKPTQTLEIGLAYGLSALYICDALQQTPGARHIAIDPAQFSPEFWKGIGVANLKAAGYGAMVDFYELPAHRVLPQLEADGVKIDFAFIDGSHLFDYALVDFFCLDQVLKVGGVVAFDDLWMPSIQRLCRFILTNRAYSVLRYFPENPSNGTTLSPRRKFLRNLSETSPVMRKMMKVEFTEPQIDLALGLPNQCIAFRKEGEDTRPWDFHREF